MGRRREKPSGFADPILLVLVLDLETNRIEDEHEHDNEKHPESMGNLSEILLNEAGGGNAAGFAKDSGCFTCASPVRLHW